MESHQDDLDKVFKSDDETMTYKEKRRKIAKEKRQKDEMRVTIAGIVIYSIALIGVVILSYVGFKSFIINKQQERQAIKIEEELRQKEALEEQKKAEEEQKKAEEEAALLKAKQEEEARLEEEENSFKDTVFSVIEDVNDPGNALVNTFDFARKSLDDDTSKLMDYEVYTNPDTKEMSKITTRENCGDLYEITDYYFDSGKINYIAQYRQDTDIPVDLSGDKIESRFYFNNKGNMLRYIYCESGKATEYSSNDFDLYSDGTIEQYKYMENMMLESSKTVFENAKKLGEKVVISGYVQDELNQPVAESANIQLLDENGRVVLETETNGDGFYEFSISPDDEKEYQINISGRDDMVETRVYGIKAPRGTKSVDVDTAYLAYSVYDTIYPVSIFVKDADNSSIAVSGANVRFRYGINNRDGETCLSGVLGEAGEIMPQLRSGNYTIEISKDGYETCYAPVSIKGDKMAFVIYAVKDVQDNCVKCVLSYETTPLDLDIKALDTYGRNVYKSINDSVGITMAETIAINGLDNGVYTFYGYDYTDIVASDMMSYNLSGSGAKMYVYDSEGLQAVYPVPAGHAGVVWRPFEIRNHKIITINDYYAYIAEDSPFRSK